MANPQDIVANIGNSTVTPINPRVQPPPPEQPLTVPVNSDGTCPDGYHLAVDQNAGNICLLSAATIHSIVTEQGDPPPAQPTAAPPPANPNMIRNISQTVQEREIIKTAPDVVVFLDGLPYLINEYINDPHGNHSALVNFNDHVVSFSATYDVDTLIPNCTISLQVPNYLRYLYQMPGGNNLLQTMAQVQVYAKSYFMAGGTGDTVYRRVFKGVTAYIGYNDNGRTLEISIQCHGIMHLLEKMQINIHPSSNTVQHSGSHLTIWQSKLGTLDCFSILAQVFLDALRSDGFQFGNLYNQSMGGRSRTGVNPFWDAVSRGYMVKWQAILTNMAKDIHIFGPYKDTLADHVVMKKDPNWGQMGKDTQTTSVQRRQTQNEADLVAEYNTYYGQINTYFPFKNITAMDLTNDVIVNRLDVIREVVQKMDYEAYQDIDGKVIIKPPIYNLDVTHLGTRTSMTQTNLNSSHNSLTNPATTIYETNNPFVIYLSEILTEQENEDESAIRRTRTTVCGNISKALVIQYDPSMATAVGEYIDVTKLAKFGLREEPLHVVPWIQMKEKYTLFAHAAAETVRANRGYRTYTFTIPMRPELKLGFPVYIPHKDMYAYVKSISLNFSIGGTATMTVMCDSVRRRVLISTTQTSGSGNSQITASPLYTPAPNLVYQWTQTTTTTTNTPIPNQSPSSASVAAQQATSINTGAINGVSSSNTNFTNPVNVSQTMATPHLSPDKFSFDPTPDALKVYSVQSQVLASHLGNQFNSPTSTYVIKNDGDQQQGTKDPATGHGYFCINQTTTWQRPADYSYILTLTGNPTTHANSVIPFTDDKGYELISPFPWGRWVDLNTAIKVFTQQGFIQGLKDVNGNPTTINPDDLQTLQNADAFLFAGLGTPSATGDPSSQLITALTQQSNLIGGSLTGTYAPQPSTSSIASGTPAQSTAQTATPGGVQKSISQSDATVIILHYDPSQTATTGVNSLLNASQPENAFAEQLLANTQNSLQRTVDVLVSGTISPTPAVQEALLVANTPSQVPQNVQLLNQITEQ